MAINCKKYIEKFLNIRNKKSELTPFILNYAQNKLYEVIKKQREEKKPQRIIILKARQLGISTISGGVIFEQSATRKHYKAKVIAHKLDSTEDLFDMYKRFYDNIPDVLKPKIKYSNKRELSFEILDSEISVDTAGGDDILRGSTINALHLSEMAFWKNNAKQQLLGILQAVPKELNTIVIIESTANGFNEFKNMWDRAVAGKNDYYPLFIGWNEMESYSMRYDGFALTKEEEELKKRYNLTNEQLAWRRSTINNECGGDISQFKQEYPITAEEAFIHTGDCVFDKDLIINRLKDVKEPIIRGEFLYNKHFYENGNIRVDLLNNKDYNINGFSEDIKGNIKIYKKAEAGKFYVIAGDTAGEGSDMFVGQVVELKTGENVATFTHLLDEDYFTEQIYCLGMYYNNATIGIENNFNTYPTKQLERMGYPNQFIRRMEDKTTSIPVAQYGFKTTSITRPLIISILKSIVKENIELINDRETLNEMLSFVRTTRKPAGEADIGTHDDKVISLAIAYYIRGEILT